MRKISVVTTTIHVPHFLKAYSDDAQRYGHDVNFIVVGDRKSPADTANFCQTIPDCVYMDIEAQREYMLRFPELWHHLPFDSFERRNIGILRAYETGCDVMVTIDDDNLLATEDVFRWHAMPGDRRELPLFKSTSGWYNVCSHLKEENDVEFYHRGYSPRHRWEIDAYGSAGVRQARMVVNAGLWFNDPDVDAVTRLERKLNVVELNTEPTSGVGTFGLAPGTWSPFNCQNTAIAREAIPAYFLSPAIGRHSDIFASYIVNRLAQHFGDVVAFGNPMANHARTTYPHNLWHDFEIEKEGIQRTDEFCDQLRAIYLPSGLTYHEGFGVIARQLKGFDKITEGMQIWHETFKRIV